MKNLKELIEWATAGIPEGTVAGLRLQEQDSPTVTPLSQLEIDLKGDFVRVVARASSDGKPQTQLVMPLEQFMSRISFCRDPALPQAPWKYIGSSSCRDEGDGFDDFESGRDKGRW